jgi:hypothetical protein
LPTSKFTSFSLITTFLIKISSIRIIFVHKITRIFTISIITCILYFLFLSSFRLSFTLNKLLVIYFNLFKNRVKIRLVILNFFLYFFCFTSIIIFFILIFLFRFYV